MRLRPHPAWMVSYSLLVRQHLHIYGPMQLAQLVWSYGQLTPAPPYSRLYFRPPKQLVRELLRWVKAWGLTDGSAKCHVNCLVFLTARVGVSFACARDTVVYVDRDH